mmetsp:Transcript_15411/g.39785  ORF Transcript_15411/g.39785 Transcript_15411/m.39785 type:complete len:442 (-) Transcript_15411:189-1514(-)
MDIEAEHGAADPPRALPSDEPAATKTQPAAAAATVVADGAVGDDDTMPVLADDERSAREVEAAPTSGTSVSQPLLDAPLEVKGKRQRKAVDRMEALAPPPKPKKEVLIGEAGPGTLVGELGNVLYWLSVKKSDQLIPIHMAMYGVRGKNKDIKKNIRAFSGYPVAMPEAEKAKRVLGLEKRILPQLKEIATWLDVEVTGSKGDIVAAIVQFLEKPTSSGRPHPKEVKDKVRARKEKKKAAKARGKGRRRPARPTSEPRPPQSALVLYALGNRDRVKAENDIDGKPELMQLLKNEFKSLGQKERSVWTKRAEADALRYARELKAYEEAQADDDLLDLLELDEPASSRKRKSKATAQASKPTEVGDVNDEDDDDDDDDEPLVKRVRSGPSDAELNAAVARILSGADLESLTKKKVRSAVADMFPDDDLTEKKGFLNECIKSHF